MKAVVWRGDRTLDIETVEDARLEASTDVLLRLTSTAICGTDLHIYEGRKGEVDCLVIGHEPLGVVEEVGSAVVSIRKGDRVVVPTHICCGFCYNCVRGYSASCLTTNPGSVGAAYGYPGMGPYRGTQTELVRIPFADANCLRLPGEPGDQWEHDFVLLADAFPTGYHATELAQVTSGDSVAIFGAGAIGCSRPIVPCTCGGRPKSTWWTTSPSGLRKPESWELFRLTFAPATRWNRSSNSAAACANVRERPGVGKRSWEESTVASMRLAFRRATALILPTRSPI